MTIDKLRRLWYLSTVPTHSPDSLKELHQLVREAIIHLLSEENFDPKIIEACAPYCDEKTVDGFIMWFQSWWKTKIPKKVVEDKNGVYCPDCHEMLAEGHGDAIVFYGEKQQRFCPNCGRTVKWDG